MIRSHSRFRCSLDAVDAFSKSSQTRQPVSYSNLGYFFIACRRSLYCFSDCRQLPPNVPHSYEADKDLSHKELPPHDCYCWKSRLNSPVFQPAADLIARVRSVHNSSLNRTSGGNRLQNLLGHGDVMTLVRRQNAYNSRLVICRRAMQFGAETVSIPL